MKKLYFLFALIILVFACSPKTTAPARQDMTKAVPKVSYDTEVSALLLKSCAPCHYPAQDGKKKPFDSYEAAKNNITDIIARVELPQDDPKFMPFKLKKPALTAEEIALLKNWAKGGYSM
jgi:hypothetical protein